MDCCTINRYMYSIDELREKEIDKKVKENYGQVGIKNITTEFNLSRIRTTEGK